MRILEPLQIFILEESVMLNAVGIDVSKGRSTVLSCSQAVSSSTNPLMYLISPGIFMISPNTLALLKEIPRL